jgi:dienelactone hydrolase
MEFTSTQPDVIKTLEVEYIDEMDGKELMGHLSLPSDKWARPLPAIVILPDWDGANDYEKERATALAELGYVAMVADIYGADKQFVETFEERGALVGQYLANPELYVSRIQAAIDQVKALTGDVDANEIGIAGYCFGASVSGGRTKPSIQWPPF